MTLRTKLPNFKISREICLSSRRCGLSVACYYLFRVDALGISMIRDGDEAKTYLAAGSSMITVVLQVPGEPELLKLRDKLQQSQIGHSLWKEEPEKIPTALASVPIRKSAGKVFKGLKLLS